MAHTPEYLEAVLRGAKDVIPSALWNQIHQQARGSAGGQLSGSKTVESELTEAEKAAHTRGPCPPGMVRRGGRCVPKGSSSSRGTAYKQEDLPKNKFGLTTGQTLQLIEARRVASEARELHSFQTGRFQQSESVYVVPAPSDEVSCGTCRFFLRSGESELGRCQVVEGDIAWFATCDYYIAAEDEAAAAFDQIQQSEDPPERLSEIWKAWSGHTNLVVSPWIVEKTVRRCREEDLDPDKPAEDQQYCVFNEAGTKLLSRQPSRAEAMTELSRIERFSKSDPELPAMLVTTPQELRIASRVAFSFPGSQGLMIKCSCRDHGSERYEAIPRTPTLTKQALSAVPPAIPDTARIVFVSATPTAVEASRGVPMAGPDGRTFQELYAKVLGLPDGDWGAAHAVPVEIDLVSTTMEAEVERWSDWLSGVLKGSEKRIVVALGRAAKKALGDRADFTLPHPSAVRRKGNSGEVARKMRAIRKEIVKRALTKLQEHGGLDESALLFLADLTKTKTARSIQVELAVGAVAKELIEEPGDRVERAFEPIFKENADELQVVYGVVLTPYVVDTQDDWAPPAEIQKAAHQYIPSSRVIGTDHERVSTAFPVESWIESYPSRDDYQKAMRNEDHSAYRRKFGGGVVRSGEWVQGTKVPDEGEWLAVKTGERASYSIGGFGSRTPGDVSQMPTVEFIDIG